MLIALRGPFRHGEREGRYLIAVPAVAWFVPHTAYSLWAGFWPNAGLNAVLALLFGVPPAATSGMLSLRNSQIDALPAAEVRFASTRGFDSSVSPVRVDGCR